MRTILILILIFLFLGANARPDTCIPVRLDSVGSTLLWPTLSGSPQNPMGWGNWGYQYGQGGHRGSDYYAMDWSRTGGSVCDTPFLAPMSGRIVVINGGCPTGCVASAAQCGNYGNQLAIESDVAPGFYFRVAHLSSVSVEYNDHVQTGQVIGRIGSTGFSTGPHAHAVLYRNTNQFLSNLDLNSGSPDNKATPFGFGATCRDVITSVPISSPATSLRLYPNPASQNVQVSAPAMLFPLRYTIHDLNGRQLGTGILRSPSPITVGQLPEGVYVLEFTGRTGTIRKKLLRQ